MERETLVSEVVMIDLVYWDSYCIIGYGPIVICPNPPTQEQNFVAQNKFNVSQYVNSRRDIGTDVDSGESSGRERIIQILETDVDSGRSCRRPGLIEIQVKHFSFEDGELIENTGTTNSAEEEESVRKNTDTDEADKDIRHHLDRILSKNNPELDHSSYLSPASQNEYQVNAFDSLNPDSTSNSVSNGLLSTTFDSLSDDVFETESQTEARKGLLMYALHRSKGNLDLHVENTSDSTPTSVQKSERNSDDEGDENTREFQGDFRANEEINEAGLEHLVVKENDIIGSCDETLSLSLESLSTDLTGSSQSGSYSLLSLFDSESEVDRREEIITVRKSDSFEHKTKQLQSKKDVCDAVEKESVESSEAKTQDNSVEEAAGSTSLSSQLNIDEINAEFDVSEVNIDQIESSDNAASVDITVSEKNTEQDNVLDGIYVKEDESSEKIDGTYTETCEKIEEGNATMYMTQNDTSNADDPAIDSETEILTQRQVENDMYEGNDSDDTSESMSVSVDLEICVRVDLGSARDRDDKLFLSHANNEDGALALEESFSNEYSFLAYTRMFKDKRHQQLIENKSASHNKFQKDSAEKIAKQIVEKVLRASQNMVAETTDKALSERTGNFMEPTEKVYGDNTEAETESPIKKCQLQQEQPHCSDQQNGQKETSKISANAGNIHVKDLTPYNTDSRHLFENSDQERNNLKTFQTEKIKSVDTEGTALLEKSENQLQKVIETQVEMSCDMGDDRKQDNKTFDMLKVNSIELKKETISEDSEYVPDIFNKNKAQRVQPSDTVQCDINKSIQTQELKPCTTEIQEDKYSSKSDAKQEIDKTIKTPKDIENFQSDEHLETNSTTDTLKDIQSSKSDEKPEIDKTVKTQKGNENAMSDEQLGTDSTIDTQKDIWTQKSDYRQENDQSFEIQDKTVEQLETDYTIKTQKYVEQPVNDNTIEMQEKNGSAKSDEPIEFDITFKSQEDITADKIDGQSEMYYTIDSQENTEAAKSDKQPDSVDTIEIEEDIKAIHCDKHPKTDISVETEQVVEPAKRDVLQEKCKVSDTKVYVEAAKKEEHTNFDCNIKSKVIETDRSYGQSGIENTIERQEIEVATKDEISDNEAAGADRQSEVDNTYETEENIEAAKSDKQPEIDHNYETEEDIETDKSKQLEINHTSEIDEDLESAKNDKQPEIDNTVETEDIKAVENDKQPEIDNTHENYEEIEDIKSDIQPEIDNTYGTGASIEVAQIEKIPWINNIYEIEEDVEAVSGDKQPWIDNTFKIEEDLKAAKSDKQQKIDNTNEPEKDIEAAKCDKQPEIDYSDGTEEDIETARNDKQREINHIYETEEDIEAGESDKRPEIDNNFAIEEDLEAGKSHKEPEIDIAHETEEDIEAVKSDKQLEIDDELPAIYYNHENDETIEAARSDIQPEIDNSNETEDIETTKYNKQPEIDENNETEKYSETIRNDKERKIDHIYEIEQNIEAVKSEMQQEINNTDETEEVIKAIKNDELPEIDNSHENQVAKMDKQSEIENTHKTEENIETANTYEHPEISNETTEIIEATKSDEQPEVDNSNETQKDIESAKSDEQSKVDKSNETKEKIKSDDQPWIINTPEIREDTDVSESDKRPEIGNTFAIEEVLEAGKSDNEPEIDNAPETEEDIEAAKSDKQPEIDNTYETKEDIESGRSDKPQEIDHICETVDIEASKNGELPVIDNPHGNIETFEVARSDKQPEIDNTHETENIGTAESGKQPEININDKTEQGIETVRNDKQYEIDHIYETVQDIEAAKSKGQPEIDNTAETEEVIKTKEVIQTIKNGELPEIDNSHENDEKVQAAKLNKQPEMANANKTEDNIKSTIRYKQPEINNETKEVIKSAKSDEQSEVDKSNETEEDIETVECDKRPEIDNTFARELGAGKSDNETESDNAYETKKDIGAAVIDKKHEINHSYETEENIEAPKRKQLEIDHASETDDAFDTAKNDKQPEIDNTDETEFIKADKNDEQSEICNPYENDENIEAAKSDKQPETENSYETEASIEVARTDKQPGIDNVCEIEEDIEAASCDKQCEIDNTFKIKEDLMGAKSDKQPEIDTDETKKDIEAARNDNQREIHHICETVEDIEAARNDELPEIENAHENNKTFETARSDIPPEIDNSHETEDNETAKSDKQPEIDTDNETEEDLETVINERQHKIYHIFETKEDTKAAKSDKQPEVDKNGETQEDIETVRNKQHKIDHIYETEHDIEAAKSEKQLEIDKFDETEEVIKATKNDELPEIDNSHENDEKIQTAKMDKQPKIENTVESEENIETSYTYEQTEINKEINESAESEKQPEVYNSNGSVKNIKSAKSDEHSEVDESNKTEEDSKTIKKDKQPWIIKTPETGEDIGAAENDKRPEIGNTFAIEEDLEPGKIDNEPKIDNVHETEEDIDVAKSNRHLEIYHSDKTEENIEAVKSFKQPEINNTGETEEDITTTRNDMQQEIVHMYETEEDIEASKNDETPEIDNTHETKEDIEAAKSDKKPEVDENIETEEDIKAARSDKQPEVDENIETVEYIEAARSGKQPEVDERDIGAVKSDKRLEINNTFEIKEDFEAAKSDKQHEVVNGDGTDEDIETTRNDKQHEIDHTYKTKEDVAAAKSDKQPENDNTDETEENIKATKNDELPEINNSHKNDENIQAAKLEVELTGIKEIVEVLEVCQQAEMAAKLVIDNITSDFHLTEDVKECDSQTKVLVDEEHVHQFKINGVRKRYQRKEINVHDYSSDLSDDSSDSIDDTGQYHPELYEQLTVPKCQKSEVESMHVKPEIGCLSGSQDDKNDENKKCNDELNDEEMHMSETEINKPENDSSSIIKEQKDSTNLKQKIPDERLDNSVISIDTEDVESSDEDSENIDDSSQYHPELYVKRPELDGNDTDKELVSANVTNSEHSKIVNSKDIDTEEKQKIPNERLDNSVINIDTENVDSSDEDSENIDDSSQYHPELYVKRPELDDNDTDKELVSVIVKNSANSKNVNSKDKGYEDLHNGNKENQQPGIGHSKNKKLLKQMSILSISAHKTSTGEKTDAVLTKHGEYSSDNDTDSDSIDDTGQYHPELYTQLTLPLRDKDKNDGHNNKELLAKDTDTNQQLQRARLSCSKEDHETEKNDTNARISDFTAGPEQDIENIPSSSVEFEGLFENVENAGGKMEDSSLHFEPMCKNASSAELFQDVNGDFKNTEGNLTDSDISKSAIGGAGMTESQLKDTVSQKVVHSCDIEDKKTQSKDKLSSQVQRHVDEINRIPLEVSVKINDMPGKIKRVQESKKKSRIMYASQEKSDIKKSDVHMSKQKMDNSEINTLEVEENSHTKERSKESKSNKRAGESKNADKRTVGVEEDTLTKGSEQSRESRSKTVKQPIEAEDFKRKSKSKSPDNSHHKKKELSCYPGDDKLVSVKSEKLRAVGKVTDSTSQGNQEKERKKHSKSSEERKYDETKKCVKEQVEDDRVRDGKSKERKSKDSDKLSTVKTELSDINKTEDENIQSKKSGSSGHKIKRSKHGNKKETGNHVEVIHAEIHSQCDRESPEDVIKDEFDLADDEDVKSKSENSTKKEDQDIKDKHFDLSSDQQENEQTSRKRSVDGKISDPLADDIEEDTEGSVDPTVVSHKLEKWLQEKRDISIRKETERFIKGGIPEEKLHIKQRVQATANEQRRQRSRDEVESSYSRRERSRQNSLEHKYRRSRQGSQEQIYRSPDGVYGRSRHNSQEGLYVSRRGSQEGLYRRSRQNSVDGILERSSYSSQEGKLTRSRKGSQDEGVRSYMNSPDGRFSRNSQSSQEEINERFRNRYQNEAVHERNRYNHQNERYIRSRHNSMDHMSRHSGDGQENDIFKGRDGIGESSDHNKYKDDDIYGYSEEQKNNRKDVFEKSRQCSHDDMYERKELSRQNSSEHLNESRKSPVFDEEFLEGRLGRKADYIEVKKFRRENKINDKRRANFLTSAQLRIFCEPKKKNEKPVIGPVEMVSVSYERQKVKENEKKTIELNSSTEKTKNIEEDSSYSSSLQPKTFDVYRYEKHHKRGWKSNLKLDKMDKLDDQYRDNRVQLNESGFSHKDWENCQIHNRNVSAAKTSHSELYHVNQYSKNRCAKKHDASVGTKVVTANANQGNGDAFYLSDPDYVHGRSKYQQNLRGQKYPKNPNGPKDNGRMRIPAGSRETSKDGPLSLTDTFAPMERGHSENHNMSNPNLSAGKLSDSTTSLNNRQAPAKSPSRQNTLQKQTSIQSNQSEINGEKRDDPHGIKFERLKNLEEDELMAKIKEIIGHLEKLEDYHRGDGMRIQKMLGDMYWDYTHLREMIADCMAENGYAVVSMKMLKTLNGIGIFKNDDVWFPTYYTYNTMWNFSDASSNLARTLSENDAVRLLTLNCGHKPYINALHSKNVFYVIKASLSILHNMARNSGMKHLFDENKTSETVMPFMESEDEMLKILATLTIANIVDEEENKTVIAETGTIHNMVSWIEKAISLPRRRFKGFTPQELTEGLNKLAVNDSNKMRIIEEGAIPLFHLMLQHEDVREQSSAGRIIWTLSFDKDVRNKLIENTDLIATLEKITESTNKSVQQNANGALWIIKGENDISRETKPKGTPTKSHVFLSYSWSDKDTVLAIRDKLRSEGYAVWIDIEKGSSASLEGMANAIENSAVVLICMSEKYKQNPNCRTEAEYTFQLKKDYIPLMLQKKYRPDGWLGFILGAKLYFDFSGKYPFDKSFTGLLKELRGRGQVTPNTTPVGSNETSDGAMATSQSLTSYASPGTPVPSNSVLMSMGQEELVKWLRNVKLTECIPAFLEFDGKLLMQLKQMRVEAPEFFYQCLEKRLNMSLIEILKFTRALEDLH